MKKGQIFWTLAEFVIYYSKLIFPSADLWTTIWNKSGLPCEKTKDVSISVKHKNREKMKNWIFRAGTLVSGKGQGRRKGKVDCRFSDGGFEREGGVAKRFWVAVVVVDVVFDVAGSERDCLKKFIFCWIRFLICQTTRFSCLTNHAFCLALQAVFNEVIVRLWSYRWAQGMWEGGRNRNLQNFFWKTC
jgi:hypothetical protein